MQSRRRCLAARGAWRRAREPGRIVPRVNGRCVSWVHALVSPSSPRGFYESMLLVKRKLTRGSVCKAPILLSERRVIPSPNGLFRVCWGLPHLKASVKPKPRPSSPPATRVPHPVAVHPSSSWLLGYAAKTAGCIWWYNQRTQRLATAAATTEPGLPRDRKRRPNSCHGPGVRINR